MASKRTIKKQLNGMIYDIVDECYSLQLYNPSKTAATEQLIDEADEYLSAMMGQISKANSKPEFRDIRANMEEKGMYFVEKVNSIQ